MTTTDVYLAAASSPPPDQTGPTHANYERSPSVLPVSIPESQLYYWTLKWQTDEAESIRELDNGESVTFDNADAVIRWLLDPLD